MRRVISGAIFDTAAPRVLAIGTAKFGSRNALDAWEAGLYRTSGGRYFIAGNGGPMSRFAGSEKIIPLSPDEARAWAGQYLKLSRDIEKIFFPVAKS